MYYDEDELEEFINQRKNKTNTNFILDDYKLAVHRQWANVFVGSGGYQINEIEKICDIEALKAASVYDIIAVPEEYIKAREEYSDHWLVHMVRDVNFNDPLFSTKPPFNAPFDQLINNWDVVSCSLTVLRNGMPNDVIASVGFLLSVPPQNIIGAHNTDIWIPNHIGSEYLSEPPGLRRIQKAGLLAQSLLTNVNMLGPLEGQDRSSSMTNVLMPHEVLQTKVLDSNTGEKDINEVLVIGRSNISIYPGKFVTAPIIVRAIIIAPCQWDKSKFALSKELYAYCWKVAVNLRKVNPNLSIKVAEHLAPDWNWNECDPPKEERDTFL